MRLRKLPAKLIIVAIALSLLLPVTVAYGAQKADTVTLTPNGASGISGSVTVVVTTGRNGGATVSVTLDRSVLGETYLLWVGRNHREFAPVGDPVWIIGTGYGFTTPDIPIDKAPTNGQVFELVNLYAGQVLALSEPIKY